MMVGPIAEEFSTGETAPNLLAKAPKRRTRVGWANLP